jgi:hypothetical protein
MEQDMNTYGASQPPVPYEPILATNDMALLFDKLVKSGWVDAKEQDLSAVVEDRRHFVFSREVDETHLEVSDQGSHIGCKVELHVPNEFMEGVAEHILFEANHISVHRFMALLHVMGIVQATDPWVRWYEAQVWG